MGGGGGGGDSGGDSLAYMQARDAEEKARKKKAISKLNQIFGVEGEYYDDADAGGYQSAIDLINSQFAAPISAPDVVSPDGTVVQFNPEMASQYAALAEYYPHLQPFADAVANAPLAAANDKAAAANSRAGREAAYKATTASNKSARNADYDRVRNDVSSFHTDRMNQDAEKVARKLKFALLGSGNWGGSGELDAKKDFNETRNRGVMDVANLANSASTGVRQSDNDKLVSLIAAVNAGMEDESAASAASSHTQTAAQRAIEQARGASFANLFDRFSGDRLFGAQNAGLLRAQQGIQPRTIAGTPGGGSYYGAYQR